MRRPNILFFVTDQQRRDSIGAYGSTLCRTPTIDRLAREGMRFERAYTPTGLCSPARCSLLTGVYPHGHGVLTNISLHPIKASLRPEQDVMTPALLDGGYRCGYVGKWHVSDDLTPKDFGFEDYHSLGDYVTWRRAKGIPFPEAFFDYRTQSADRCPGTPETSRPAWICDRAIDMVDKYAAGNSPFFIRIDFHGPHYPNVVPEPYFSMYPPTSISPWPNHDDPLTGKPAVHRIKKRHYGTDRMTWADWQPFVSAYLGEISLIDAQAGRVLAALERHGILDDTLVIWTSDHGDTIGAHGICNKDYTMYEEIYRVPLVMRWPGRIRPGQVCDDFVVHFLDLNATVRELAGMPPAAGAHGRSLVPILHGERPIGWRDSAFCEFHGSHMGLYSMRLLADRRFSYVYHTNDIDELYDHATDPHELVNLAEDPGDAASALAAMKRRMVGWMAETGDHLHNEWTVLWLTGDETAALAAPGRRRTAW